MSVDQTHEDGAGHDHTQQYVKIWAILVVLLIVSVVGPMFGILWLTLATAFGIACVKAYLVASRFMHINQEPKFIAYLTVTCLLLMLLLFAGTAPDVMKDNGSNWIKPEAMWQADSGLPGHGGHGETSAVEPDAGAHH